MSSTSQQIGFVGSVDLDVSPKSSCEFTFQGKRFRIDANCFWTLKPGVTCFGDPWVEHGKLCGFVIDSPELQKQDRELGQLRNDKVSELSDLANPSGAECEQATLPCRHFAQGRCKFGDKCKNSHISPTKKPCSFFAKGFCKFGNACRFEH